MTNRQVDTTASGKEHRESSSALAYLYLSNHYPPRGSDVSFPAVGVAFCRCRRSNWRNIDWGMPPEHGDRHGRIL